MLVKIQIVFTVATNPFLPDITMSSDAVFLKTKSLLGFSGVTMLCGFFLSPRGWSIDRLWEEVGAAC